MPKKELEVELISIPNNMLDTIYTDSVITNQDRYNAIAEASKESFDELIAKLALKGYKLKKD